MCNSACIQFGRSHLSPKEIANKKVIEVGALNVNGSLRAFVESLGPHNYLGVDIVDGPGVDEICDVNDLVATYGGDSFDVVISTELLEHVREWRNAIPNLKNILKPNGILLLTTRSKGFPYHGYPFDFWRYEGDDMKAIFSDFSIVSIQNDPLMPGVFIKALKPVAFWEKNLKSYDLYTIIKRKRCRNIHEFDIIFIKLLKLLSRILPSQVKISIKRVIFKEDKL